MTKLGTLLFTVGLMLILQASTAQTSINRFNSVSVDEDPSLNFIDAISFTPDGILKTADIKSFKDNKETEIAKTEIKSAGEDMTPEIEKLSELQYKYAMMMDVDVESLKNISLLGYIDDWFGTRYRLGGDSKRGIDCSALTGGLFLAIYGLVLPRTSRQQYQVTERIKEEDLKEGDLVFFNIHRHGVSHVGIYLENHYFVHASLSQGVTISNLDDPYYAKRFVSGGRVRE